ncbi:MAG: hypothetical protein K1Y02_22165, partial [Candidatus Hydrogenedentes bacterium]|nr:hypothetical protein [Candidatus Hydrogenedentota bacterium]
METALRTVRDIEEGLASFSWMDPHTHVDAAHLTARGLDDILLYHMVVSDLFAAGCPSGSRLDEDRSQKDAHTRLAEAIPYLARARNTFMASGLRAILVDLYNWREPINESNWRRLDEIIRERSQDTAWARDVTRRANIARTGTELWRQRDGSADDLLQYSLEWAFFARTQWGQPDIPVFELERAWNEPQAGVAIPVTYNRKTAPPLKKTIRTVEDVHAAVLHYCDLIPYGTVLATAQHISTDIEYSNPSDGQMAEALERRASAGDAERNVYASYILHRFLSELEKREQRIVFQFSLGAEPLPYESSSRVSQRTIGQLADIISRYPRLRFMCFLGSRHANQALCTLARELPNFSLAGYWWHNFFPGAIQQVMEERLDMLPVNKQIGFFS